MDMKEFLAKLIITIVTYIAALAHTIYDNMFKLVTTITDKVTYKIIARLCKILSNILDKLYSKEKQNTIVDEIYHKKKRQYNQAFILILISIIISHGADIFFHVNTDTGVLIFLYALIGFIIISRLLISYRIKKGYYGTNYGESKEILYYITVDRNRNNKNTGKKIFNDIDAYNKVEEKIPEDSELQY